MSQSQNKIRFKVHSLRRLPDPTAPEKRARYFAFCNTADLPADLPKETNPRKQNLNTKVAKAILNGFVGTEPGEAFFHVLNRGLLISAESVQFNNDTKELVLTLSDLSKHGLVDGGHTYRIIKENQDDLQWSQFVTLEIMTGIEEDFEKVARARNTSIQVKEKSLAALEGKLDVIKRIVAGLPFEKEVAYEEFAKGDIDVLEVIAILTIFHNNLHKVPPVHTYSSKERTLGQYLGDPQGYGALDRIAPQVFELHDHIKRTMWDRYNESTGGHLGKLTEIGSSKRGYPLLFSPRGEEGEYEMIQYGIPSGWIYPILGGMRFLAEYNGTSERYRWRIPPIKFYDEVVGAELVRRTSGESKDSGRNPNAVGKNRNLWDALYDGVARAFYERKSA